MSQIWEEIH